MKMGSAIHYLRRFVCATATALMTFSWAVAGNNFWTNHGPRTPEISAIVLDPLTPGTLYAGTYGGGLFRSTDGGGSWQNLFAGTNVRSLAIDPANPQVLYVGQWGGLLRKSTNGGISWSDLPSGTTGIPSTSGIEFILIDSANSQTIYIGMGGDGIYKSTNGGSTFSAAKTGLTLTNVTTIAMDPGNHQLLYAGTYAGTSAGLFKTTDGGGSWVLSHAGLPVANNDIYAVGIDPSNSQILYVSTHGAGVYKSTNGGAAWTAVNNGISHWDMRGLVLDPVSPQTLYAATWRQRIFKSTNGGSSWIQSGSGIPNYAAAIYTLAIQPGSAQTLYAGSEGGGVFKSTNSGSSWDSASTGINHSNTNALAFVPGSPQTLYAAVHVAGLFRSLDGGTSWAPYGSPETGLITDTAGSIAIDPNNSQVMYVGTGWEGVFQTTNGGATWIQKKNELPSSNIRSLLLDPAQSQTLYAGTRGNGVYKTINAGTNWASASNGMTDSNVNDLAFSPASSQTVYAGTDTGIFKSTDGGGSWSGSSGGLPTNTWVNSIAPDPSNPNTLYAGVGNPQGVWKSTNGGTTWYASSSGLSAGSVWRIAVDSLTPSTLYLIGINGAFLSTDSGGLWTPINNGLGPSADRSHNFGLLVLPTNPRTIHVTYSNLGVWSMTRTQAASAPLQLVEVRPNQGWNDVPNEITLVGNGFVEGISAALLNTAQKAPAASGGTTVLATTYVSATELRATVPEGLVPGTYAVSVTNPDNRSVTLPAAYTVLDSLSGAIDDLYGYSYELWTSPATPHVGTAGAIGLLVHRNGGKNVRSNISVDFRKGDCGSGASMGSGAIAFLSPDSTESTNGVPWTPSAMGEVTICAVIDPGNTAAESREDNNQVLRTVSVLGALPDNTPPHVDSFRVAQGAAATGSLSIKLDAAASDASPSSGLASLFYQEFEYNQGVKSWIPVQQSGWVPYATASSNYDWKLVPFVGMHALQAWAIDQAGNVSVFPYKGSINYTPPTDSIRRQQVRIYRQSLTVGQTLTVTVTPVTGDPDLYVWAPESAKEPPWISNLSVGIDQVVVAAPVAGVYQVEVHGNTAAQYQLMMGVAAVAARRAMPDPMGGIDPDKEQADRPVLWPSEDPGSQIAAPSASLVFIRLPLVLR